MAIEQGDKVVVVGGTGVIGAWVVLKLKEAGLAPVIATRGMTSAGTPILAAHGIDCETVALDITDRQDIHAKLSRLRPAGVIHMASSKPWQIEPESASGPDPQTGARNIIEGTLNLMEIAAELDLGRFLYASSKSVYEPFTAAFGYPDYKPVPEDYPCNPNSFYGIDKRAAELSGRLYRNKLGLDFSAVRFATTYGPLKRGDGIHPALLLCKAARGETISIEVDEHQYHRSRDDLIYNEDVARGMVQCFLAAGQEGWVYNLGGGVGYTLEEVVEHIRKSTGFTDISVTVHPQLEAAPFDKYMREHSGVLDISAARADFGFDPRPLSEGFAETVRLERSIHATAGA